MSTQWRNEASSSINQHEETCLRNLMIGLCTTRSLVRLVWLAWLVRLMWLDEHWVVWYS